jgi:hypothetical protein
MAYDFPGGFPIENPIDRFQLGTYDKLKRGSEGSLTIFIQAENPGKEKESSWLPIPKDQRFYLGMRVYNPQSTAITRDWLPPTVMRVR